MNLGMHTVTTSMSGEVTVQIPADYPDGTPYTWVLTGPERKDGNGTVRGGMITVHLGRLGSGNYNLNIKVDHPTAAKEEDYPIDIPSAFILEYEKQRDTRTREDVRTLVSLKMKRARNLAP